MTHQKLLSTSRKKEHQKEIHEGRIKILFLLLLTDPTDNSLFKIITIYSVTYVCVCVCVCVCVYV